jgi:tubulin--tyrosine ligase
VNDDGPPSAKSSPYVYDLIRALQAANHVVSVVLPHTQRSWIAKAHIVGQSIKPTYYRPYPAAESDHSHVDQGITTKDPLPESSKEEEWVLVDSTPASCVQIGLYHYFKDRGPIDLVVSGPNYGRNTTAAFALSSGTLGGALEAAVCGVRAIALSYAFNSREHDSGIIQAACRMSLKVIENLAKNWNDQVHVYSVNVPLVKGVETTKVLWTEMLQNTWKSGSCFAQEDVPDGEVDRPVEDEMKIREGEGEAGEKDTSTAATDHIRYKHKHFRWAPNFKDVYDSVEQSAPGNDGWAVKEGYVR